MIDHLLQRLAEARHVQTEAVKLVVEIDEMQAIADRELFAADRRYRDALKALEDAERGKGEAKP